MKIERFEDLEVWKLSRKVVNYIYKTTSKDGFSRDFGLVNQMQRCSVSIMSNIAEGFERKGIHSFFVYCQRFLRRIKKPTIYCFGSKLY